MPTQEESFNVLVNKVAEEVISRLGQRDFLPNSISTRLIKTLSLVLGGYNNKGGTISIKDANGVVKITLTSDGAIVSDASNKRIYLSDDGEFKISMAGYNVDTATDAQLLMKVASDDIFIRIGNLGYPVDQGERQWTTNATWTNIKNSTFKVDGDSYKFTKVYFEVLGCVEQAGRTAYYRIYNVTASAALSGSEITTTAQSTEGADWINAELIRSAALTFPSGEKTYRLQFKQNATGGEGDSTQFFKGGLYYAQ